jgi:N-acetylmuramoyl-L-alanine amidase
MKYYKIRKFDSDAHVFEFDPKLNDSKIEFGKVGLEPLSTIRNTTKLSQGSVEVAKINLGFFASKNEHNGSVFSPTQFQGSAEGNGVECYLLKDGRFIVGNVTDKQVQELQGTVQWGCTLSYSLLIDGKRTFLNSQNYSHFNSRNPRTLIGQKADLTMCLVVVEGRSTTSKGITGEMSADIMLSLGCTQAINGDGGGSSTMIVNASVVNQLSDGKERNIGSALVIYSKPKVGDKMTTWTDKFIKPSPYSRSQTKLTGVKKLVLHFTANNGGTAKNHFDYFNNLKDRYASAHLFVDKIEALCIIPLNEVAFHCNDGTFRGVPELKPNGNLLSIGVEMCMEKDGSFHPDMIKRTEDVFVELCKKFNLDPLKDIVRHFDVTRKNCPAPWVKEELLFIDFKNRVNAKLNPPKLVPKPEKVETLPVTNEGGKVLQINGTQFNALAGVYEKAQKQGFLVDEKWANLCKERKMTESESAYINGILIGKLIDEINKLKK